MDVFQNWFKKVSGNQQIILLILLLSCFSVVLILTARILAPFFAAVVLAYLLQVFIDKLESIGIAPWLSVTVVFITALLIALALVFGLVPLLVRQIIQLAKQAPHLISNLQIMLNQLPESYPALITPAQVTQIMDQLSIEVLDFSQVLVGSLGGTVVGVATLIVYLIIVPLMVFFLVKDRNVIVSWFISFLPVNRELSREVWLEVHRQLQNYVGGKVLEILIVTFVTYVTFAFVNLQYGLLLAVVTGFSVLIPYIGAAVVAFPVILAAILQWGLGADASIAIGAYFIIQALDGNLLVPFVFSEVVNIHPVAIIVSVLFFGGIWGLWGVFFAIPLAVLVQAVIRAWPLNTP
ncbi:MAG: AI-2E family transporter [Rhodospirillaceae bacterium]|nr:AI-2E family transporter [Rhodospirillaceae bacterium]